VIGCCVFPSIGNVVVHGGRSTPYLSPPHSGLDTPYYPQAAYALDATQHYATTATGYSDPYIYPVVTGQTYTQYTDYPSSPHTYTAMAYPTHSPKQYTVTTSSANSPNIQSNDDDIGNTYLIPHSTSATLLITTNTNNHVDIMGNSHITTEHLDAHTPQQLSPGMPNLEPIDAPYENDSPGAPTLPIQSESPPPDVPPLQGKCYVGEQSCDKPTAAETTPEPIQMAPNDTDTH
jgi:hypothetical protein